MLYGALLAVAVGLGVPLAAIGGALAQARVAASAFEGMARQPDAAGDIRFALILSLSLIESLVIYVLLVFFMLYGKLPDVMTVIETAAGG